MGNCLERCFGLQSQDKDTEQRPLLETNHTEEEYIPSYEGNHNDWRDIYRVKSWGLWAVKFQKLQTRWLLLSGAADPPYNIETSNRRPRGKGDQTLNRKDIKNMEDALHKKGFPFRTVQKRDITVQEAKKEIQRLFDECNLGDIEYSERYRNYRFVENAVIYYTGHGESHTGNWCFKDGVLTLKEIMRIFRGSFDLKPTIVSECCYSGRWATECRLIGVKGKHDCWEVTKCLAACSGNEMAPDSIRGGVMTLYLSDKISDTTVREKIYPSWVIGVEKPFSQEKIDEMRRREYGTKKMNRIDAIRFLREQSTTKEESEFYGFQFFIGHLCILQTRTKHVQKLPKLQYFKN